MLNKLKKFFNGLFGKAELKTQSNACPCNGKCLCEKKELPSYTAINVEPEKEIKPTDFSILGLEEIPFYPERKSKEPKRKPTKKSALKKPKKK